jgi:hypothetical protein
MKKLILIIAIVISSISIVSAQNYVPFPESNATWVTNYSYYLGGIGWLNQYNKYYLLENDTIIDDKEYSIMYVDNSFGVFNVKLGAIRNESKKVYFRFFYPITEAVYEDLGYTYYDSTEFILYDFNYSIGDTINNCKFNSNNSYYLQDIDSVLLNNNEYRTKYIISESELIEGIGNLKGLFWSCGSTNVSNFSPSLICFSVNNSQNLINFTSISGECLLPTGIHDKTNKKNNKSFSIFPNPATDKITISSGQFAKNENIEIYNSLGSLVKNIPLPPSKGDREAVSETSIDISTFPKGMYVVKVGSETIKFVKE